MIKRRRGDYAERATSRCDLERGVAYDRHLGLAGNVVGRTLPGGPTEGS